jgi:hypothetical protein
MSVFLATKSGESGWSSGNNQSHAGALCCLLPSSAQYQPNKSSEALFFVKTSL